MPKRNINVQKNIARYNIVTLLYHITQRKIAALGITTKVVGMQSFSQTRLQNQYWPLGETTQPINMYADRAL